jgi:hypothetical protein
LIRGRSPCAHLHWSRPQSFLQLGPCDFRISSKNHDAYRTNVFWAKIAAAAINFISSVPAFPPVTEKTATARALLF